MHFLGMNTAVLGLIVGVIAGVVYLIIRIAHLKKKLAGEYRSTMRLYRLNEIVRLLFVFSIAVIAACTLIPTWLQGAVTDLLNYGETEIGYKQGGWNLVPALYSFFSSYSLAEISLLKYELLDFAENIVLYIPLGLLFPLSFEKIRFPQCLLGGFGLSFAIEMIQPFIGRYCNIDDIICNTLGAVVGYLAFLIISKLFPKFAEKCRRGVTIPK